MAVVRMMEVVPYQVIHMIAVWHGLMAATGAVRMALLVLVAAMIRRATTRIRVAYVNGVLVDSGAMNVM